MKFVNGKLRMEKGEPCIRSCWKCNGSHEHLRQVNQLHVCLACGRHWIFDRFLDSFRNIDDMIVWLKKEGMKEGRSSFTIDKGYRVTQISIRMRKQ